MKTIIYSGSRTNVQEAVLKAAKLLENESFLRIIQDKPSFDYTSITGEILACFIQKCTLDVTVIEYKSWNPFSDSNAYTIASKPKIIHLNTRRLKRSVNSIAATIVHEFLHLIDISKPEYEFGHGDNSSEGKQNTVSYWIDREAEKFLNSNHS